jgi:uncharacterized OsmC-like protein
MDAAELRAAQAPLKEQYRADPASARIPIKASSDFRDAGITTTVDGFAGPVRAGLHQALGGTGRDACSADMLLEALLGCVGTTFRSVTTALGVDPGEVTFSATGWFDARGTLGLDREAPIGVQDVVVTITCSAGLDESTISRLQRMTERYCVVGQSLATPPTIHVSTTA